VEDIAVFSIGKARDAPHTIARGSKRWFRHRCLDAVFDLIGELCSTQGEKLDSIVRCWVVGGRDHHTEIKIALFHQEGGRGCGNNTGVKDINA
jgi:hypothetical protein